MKDLFATIGVACTGVVIAWVIFGLIIFVKDQITKERFTKEQQINILYRMARVEPDVRVRLGILMAIKVLKKDNLPNLSRVSSEEDKENDGE